jgi:hypothetical protein
MTDLPNRAPTAWQPQAERLYDRGDEALAMGDFAARADAASQRWMVAHGWKEKPRAILTPPK